MDQYEKEFDKWLAEWLADYVPPSEAELNEWFGHLLDQQKQEHEIE